MTWQVSLRFEDVLNELENCKTLEHKYGVLQVRYKDLEDSWNSLQTRISELEARLGWKCFHCNEVFIDEKEAAEHFGDRRSTSRPVCEHLCSGYKVFPNGKKCSGCLDCETEYVAIKKDDLTTLFNYAIIMEGAEDSINRLRAAVVEPRRNDAQS